MFINNLPVVQWWESKREEGEKIVHYFTQIVEQSSFLHLLSGLYIYYILVHTPSPLKPLKDLPLTFSIPILTIFWLNLHAFLIEVNPRKNAHPPFLSTPPIFSYTSTLFITLDKMYDHILICIYYYIIYIYVYVYEDMSICDMVLVIVKFYFVHICMGIFF